MYSVCLSRVCCVKYLSINGYVILLIKDEIKSFQGDGNEHGSFKTLLQDNVENRQSFSIDFVQLIYIVSKRPLTVSSLHLWT